MLAAFTAIKITEHDPKSFYGLIYAIPTYASFSLVGLLAGIRAVGRREQWQLLSWIALALNGIPLICMLGIILQKVV